MSANGLIGPYFFKDGNGRAVNVNGVRYLHMLQNYFSQELYNVCTAKNLDPYSQWFMQDGASPHFRTIVQNFLNQSIIFQGGTPGRTIGRGLANNWPARSPDLTPCDFFLWGYLKMELRKLEPHPNMAVLEQRIETILAGIPQDLLWRTCVVEKERRMQLVQQHQGGHIQQHL